MVLTEGLAVVEDGALIEVGVAEVEVEYKQMARAPRMPSTFLFLHRSHQLTRIRPKLMIFQIL